jgi:hypothetical protein
VLCHQLTEDGRQLYRELTGSKGEGDLLLDNSKLKEFVRQVEEIHGDESKSDFDVLNSLGKAGYTPGHFDNFDAQRVFFIVPIPVCFTGALHRFVFFDLRYVLACFYLK